MPAKSEAQRRLMVAYLAGFLDGEGYVTIRRSNRSLIGKGKGVVSSHYRLCVGFTNKHLGVLRWIQSEFGGNLSAKARQKSHWAEAFELVISNRASVQRLLESVYPYLLIKTQQVQLGLDFMALPKVKVSFEARGKTWPRRVSVPEDLAIRETFKARLTDLNQRGNRAG